MQRRYIVEEFHEYDPKRDLFPEIPATWELWNAARPIPGHLTQQGYFLCGIFYAVINPEGDYADEMRKRCISLDGYLITHVPKAVIEAYWTEICEMYEIDHNDYTYVDAARSWIRNEAEKYGEEQDATG